VIIEENIHGSGMLEINMKKIKLLIIVLIVTIVLFGVFAIISASKTELKLTYAPGSVSIKVDGKLYKKTKCQKELCTITIKLKKGSDTISLEKENFETVTVSAKANNSEVFLISSPENQSGKDEYLDSELMQQQIQNASSAEFSYGSKETGTRYPFLDQLNLYGGGFTVGYGQSSYNAKDPYSVSLYIEAKEPKHRLDAIDAIINDLNVSPADIEIIYSDFNNPFKEQN
jgi:hypothetical protein